MNKKFVKLTKNDFIEWANRFFGENQYDFSQVKTGNEIVLRHVTNIHGLEIHIYTTLDTKNSFTRDLGKDAIRIILFDRFGGNIAYTAPKILRVEGETTIFERLGFKIEGINNTIQQFQKQDRFCKCTNHRVHTVERTNSKTGTKFFGCSIYGKCNQKEFSKLDNARIQYPLRDNPFITTAGTTPPKPRESNINIDKVIEVFSQQAQPLTNTSCHQWTVNENMECLPTKKWTHVQYPFEKFNVVQSTLYASEVWKRDCNLILGTATSSGKTICAEMVIAEILYGQV